MYSVSSTCYLLISVVHLQSKLLVYPQISMIPSWQGFQCVIFLFSVTGCGWILCSACYIGFRTMHRGLYDPTLWSWRWVGGWECWCIFVQVCTPHGLCLCTSKIKFKKKTKKQDETSSFEYAVLDVKEEFKITQTTNLWLGRSWCKSWSDAAPVILLPPSLHTNASLPILRELRLIQHPWEFMLPLRWLPTCSRTGNIMWWLSQRWLSQQSGCSHW